MRLKEFFRKLHQKRPTRILLHLGLNVIFPFIGFYAHFIEPRLVKITHQKIPIKNLSRKWEGFRIVQISDIHFGPTNQSMPFLRKCIEMINHLKPDVVAMTGDFIQWDTKFIKPLSHALSSIRTQFGLFASLGNHDYGICHPGKPPTDPIDHQEIINTFKAQGIHVLHNEKQVLEKENEQLEIIGLGDFWTPYFKPEDAFGIKNGSRPTRILLSHNPDTIHELADYEFDLMLAGHVHGGQISLPFIGPLVVPVKHRHLRRGLHLIKERWLYTNRGLGFIFKARFLSRPEIACLELVAG